MDDLVRTVNANLKDCTFCKGSCLELKVDRQIGLATNYKLVCKSCDVKDDSLRQRIFYLKRKFHESIDPKIRRKLSQEVSRQKSKLKRRKKERSKRYITSPLVKLTDKANEAKQRKTMDYAINVRAIISSFYVGTGGLDIGLGHSCLGIRGGKNWEKVFTRHSPTVCGAILNVVDEVIAEGLKEEIDLTIKEKLVEKKYSASEIVDLTQKYHKGIRTGIDEVDNVLISISFDMGWQKKGNGHTYDSNSGHAYFIGCRSGKVVRMLVYSKKCTKCDIAIAMGEEAMEHENCPRNYRTGSSKAMEASAAFDMVLQLHDLGIGIEYIISDDDSTMRAHLKHIGTEKNAKLPLHIHEPSFLCDPSHRIKVMVKDIFALALQSKAKSNAEKIDAMRLKKYCGCWIGKSKLLPFDEFIRLSKAPVEHIFD